MAKQVDLLSLSAKLDLNIAAFSKGMAQANKSLDRMDRNMKKTSGAIGKMGNALEGMAAGIAASFTVGAIKDFVASTIEAADRVDKLSQVAGLTAESFQRFEHVASLAGVSADTFAKATSTLSRRIGNARAEVGPLHSALTKLNPALLESLKAAKTNEEALLLMADAMKGAKDQAELGALSMAAFGGSADKMTIALKGGRAEVIKTGKEINVLSGINTKAAADFSDRWNVAFTNFKANAGNATLDFLRNLDAMIAKINEVLGHFQRLTNAWNAVVQLNPANLLKGLVSGGPKQVISNIFGTGEDINAGKKALDGWADSAWDAVEAQDALLNGTTAVIEETDNWSEAAWEAVEVQDSLLASTAAVSGQLATITTGVGGSGGGGGGGGGGAVKQFDDLAISIEHVTDVIIEQQDELSVWQYMALDAVDSFAAGFADTLVDGIMSGKMAFQDFAHSFLVEISKMIAEQIIFNALQKALGGIGGSFLGGLFGAASTSSYSGAYASGGTIPAGSFGLVGERGAELVRGPATVTSASDTAAAMVQPQNIRIINSIDPGVMENYLGSDAGERVIMNMLGRNKASIRNLALS